MKKLGNIVRSLLIGANIVSIVAMMVVGYSDRVDPSAHPFVSTLGLGFPFVLAVNVAFLVFWTLFRFRMVWLPALGLVLCFGPVRSYFPINLPETPPKDAMKVLSYNVHGFAYGDTVSHRHLLEYIANSKADIVCLQEAGPVESDTEAGKRVNALYQYSDTARHATGNTLTLLSKYPILSKERIPYTSQGNLSAAFYIKIGNDTVLVVNNHFESMKFTEEEKVEIGQMADGYMEGEETGLKPQSVVSKIAAATRLRAPQARAMAEYVKAHSQYPIILCGDFNDSPISYTHHQLASLLTDCHTASATGAGVSYYRKGFYVRIDNIMCSRDFKPYACRVDNTTKASDHYPIYTFLTASPKPSPTGEGSRIR